ncbi:MAG: phosphoribosylamine--glycine ligase, partial [Bacteroidota bacterium]
MNIMVLGSGGREHALAWKIRQSRHCKALYVAPGNGGTGQVAQNLAIDIQDSHQVIKALLKYQIDLLVIGPEDPLVNGLVDELQSHGELGKLRIVGPKKEGARLEGSKKFAKDFMYRYGIPTGRAKSFTAATIAEGLAFLEQTEGPYVLKADGLAAGKGVIITKSLEGAKENLEDLLVKKRFGAASEEVLIEQFLDGIELSVFVLTDGTDFVVLPEAKDYKRIGERDTG